MIILKKNTTALKLTVEGYAYSFSRDYWDSNWLSINTELKIFKTIFFMIIVIIAS